MLDRNDLMKRFDLNPPASDDEINAVQAQTKFVLPDGYRNFLRICNGLHSAGSLALLDTAALVQRNVDYEVPLYLPDYFMIGDDSGGQAILIDGNGAIFEVGMGVMSEDSIERSAHDLSELLVRYEGKTLRER